MGEFVFPCFLSLILSFCLTHLLPLSISCPLPRSHPLLHAPSLSCWPCHCSLSLFTSSLPLSCSPLLSLSLSLPRSLSLPLFPSPLAFALPSSLSLALSLHLLSSFVLLSLPLPPD